MSISPSPKSVRRIPSPRAREPCSLIIAGRAGGGASGGLGVPFWPLGRPLLTPCAGLAWARHVAADGKPSGARARGLPGSPGRTPLAGTSLEAAEKSRLGQRKSGLSSGLSGAITRLLSCGAEGETRTPTPLRGLDPEPSVSTNSTTSAAWRRVSIQSPAPWQGKNRGFRDFFSGGVQRCLASCGTCDSLFAATAIRVRGNSPLGRKCPGPIGEARPVGQGGLG